jgi:hypothetical protein
MVQENTPAQILCVGAFPAMLTPVHFLAPVQATDKAPARHDCVHQRKGLHQQKEIAQ